MDAPYPLPVASVVLPILSASAFLLGIPPLVWHVRNRNLGASCMIAWFLPVQLIYVVNPIIWSRDNTADWWDGSGLCDVEIRLLIASTIAVPGAITCIMRGLARILDVERPPFHGASRWGRILDVMLCFGLPLVLVSVYYVFQPTRYAIYTSTGCNWLLARTWGSIVVMRMGPFILSIVNGYLASESFSKAPPFLTALVLVLIRLRRFRLSLAGILERSKTSQAQFMRLLGISIVALLALIAMSGWLIFWPISQGVENFSFRDLHTDWTIDMVPTFGKIYQFDPIVAIIAGYLIFAFFGLGRDARDMYAGWLRKLGVVAGRRPSGIFSTLTSKVSHLRSTFSRKGSTIR
jgi:pheromone a factor receptor